MRSRSSIEESTGAKQLLEVQACGSKFPRTTIRYLALVGVPFSRFILDISIEGSALVMILLLPSSLFQELQTAYHTGTLQEHWKNFDTSKVSKLLQATQTEIKIRNITIPQKKQKKKDKPDKQQPSTNPSPTPTPTPDPAPSLTQQPRPPVPRIQLPYKYSPRTLGMNFGEYLKHLQKEEKKDELKTVIKDLQG